MAKTRVPFRILSNKLSKCVQISRLCSTNANSHISVDINNSGIAKVFMNKRPANAIDTDFFRSLKNTFEELNKDHIAGVILASSVPKIFSAGLDIHKMAQMKLEDTSAFTAAYYDCWSTLYEFPLPTAAAITGHAPALGCLLALTCERRVMVAGCGNIGLNEVMFGQQPDPLLVANWRRVAAPRAAEPALLAGRLFTPAEALEVGIIDELAKDREEALAKCEDFIKSFSKMPLAARGLTKRDLRRQVMKTVGAPSREELIKVMGSSTESLNKVFLEYSKKFKNKQNN